MFAHETLSVETGEKVEVLKSHSENNAPQKSVAWPPCFFKLIFHVEANDLKCKPEIIISIL